MASVPLVTEAWIRVNMEVDTTCIQQVAVPIRSVVSSACSTGSLRRRAARAVMKPPRRRPASE